MATSSMVLLALFIWASKSRPYISPPRQHPCYSSRLNLHTVVVGQTAVPHPHLRVVVVGNGRLPTCRLVCGDAALLGKQIEDHNLPKWH